MVGAGHDTLTVGVCSRSGRGSDLHAEGEAHGEVEAVLAGHPVLLLDTGDQGHLPPLLIHIPPLLYHLSYPFNNLPFFSLERLPSTHLFNPSILFQERLKLQLLEEDDAHEQKAEHNIAKVAEDVIEVTDMTEGLPGTKGMS